jgi:C_GCAxxG_C_C family probable redox protein
MDKKELIQRAYELGFEYEKTYRGCAQCTIAAVQDTAGVRNDFVFKAAGGLAAGCGLLSDGPCGGYTGGILAMSMFFARVRDKFDDDREENYCSFRMAGDLHNRFVDELGSITCREIHKKLFGRTFDLWSKEDKVSFEELGAHHDKCTGVVARAAGWTMQILLDEMNRRSLSFADFGGLQFPTTAG